MSSGPCAMSREFWVFKKLGPKLILISLLEDIFLIIREA